MIDLSFVEINSEIDKTTGKKRPFSFVIESEEKSSKAQARDVTDKLAAGLYDLRSGFTIIYLYDINNDSESSRFIEEYGGKLHNLSSANVTVLTYFPSDTAKKWQNVHFRNRIKSNPNHDGFRVMTVLYDLKTIYGIKELPAMIVAVKDAKGNEGSFCISLVGYKKEGVFQIFRQVMEIIDDNCEQDISVILDKMAGPDISATNRYGLSQFNTFEYVADLIKDKKRSGYPCTQLSFAGELGLSEKQLGNKRRHNSFTRNECIFIGVYFRIDLDDLNKLLRANNNVDLGIGGRDGVIRKCILDGKTVEETDEILIKAFGADQGIIRKKEKKEKKAKDY